ncbi:MAG: carboxylesterase family protein, partial [Desulfobacteraceae bacterium]|nr:carboxylesterase family protein [Desulfobacteraceae bacterium]
MVWIHGGAFISGSSGTEADHPYDPTHLVAKDVIVVTLNYRIGALGFLPQADLTAEAGQSGNYGLMDQHLALQWIHDNIANFNGDPDNVTLFGESAGGHSVLSQLAAASSFSPYYLFHKAIVESGAYGPTQWSLAAGYTKYGNPFVTATGCTGDIPACLRGLTVAQILDAQDQVALWPSPVYGTGAFLENSIATVFGSDGIPADVPVLLGCNKDEGQLFVLLDMAQGQFYTTEAAYNSAVATALADAV